MMLTRLEIHNIDTRWGQDSHNSLTGKINDSQDLIIKGSWLKKTY